MRTDPRWVACSHELVDVRQAIVLSVEHIHRNEGGEAASEDGEVDHHK